MSESAEKVAAEIRFEITQIDQLFTVYADLLERIQQRTPDTVEIAAVASVLHSFYNGLENIFLSIAKGFDGRVPTGAQWHRDLLVQVSKATPKRKVVISTELAEKLADYLGFRHFYRHSYAFFIDWQELSRLVISLQHVWFRAKGEIENFATNLTATDG